MYHKAALAIFLGPELHDVSKVYSYANPKQVKQKSLTVTFPQKIQHIQGLAHNLFKS